MTLYYGSIIDVYDVLNTDINVNAQIINALNTVGR